MELCKKCQRKHKLKEGEIANYVLFDDVCEVCQGNWD